MANVGLGVTIGNQRISHAVEVILKQLRIDQFKFDTLFDIGRKSLGIERLHFRLGVAYRKWFDEKKDIAFFDQAVEQWGKALAMQPNQYIWRRRIQQYGPRLIKPYPFYDWVEAATNRRGIV